MHYYCPFHKKDVDRSELVKGYEFKKNEYVIVTEEELEKAEPESSKMLDIIQFVDLSDVDPIYFDKPYALEPPDDKTSKPYRLLMSAMHEKKVAAIGRLFMREREYLVLIRPYGDSLLLHLLMFQDEIVKKKGRFRSNGAVREKEVDLAKQLIDQLTEDFDPGRFQNEYIERLQEMLDAKVQNKKVRFYKPKPRPQIGDLMEALQKSVKQASSGNTKPGKLRVLSKAPIPDYDNLNVQEIKKKIPELSPEQAQQLVDYEQKHKKRKSVITALKNIA